MRSQGERLGAGNRAARVVDALELLEQQRARGVDQTTDVVQLTVVQIQAQLRVAEQLAALLIEAADRSRQRVLTTDTAVAAVGDLTRREVQGVGTAESTVAVIEGAGGHGDRAFTAERALLAIIEAGASQQQHAIGDDLASLVIDAAVTVQLQIRRAGQATANVGQFRGVDRQRAFAADLARAVVNGAGEVQRHALLAEQFAAVVGQRVPLQGEPGTCIDQPFAAVEHFVDSQGQAFA